MAFFSFLRKSNLVSPTTLTFVCEHHLTRSNIKFMTRGCFLRIKWSKTRQHKEGIHVVPLPSIPHSLLCPVTAIHHYFSLVPANPDDNGRSLLLSTRSTVADIMAAGLLFYTKSLIFKLIVIVFFLVVCISFNLFWGPKIFMVINKQNFWPKRVFLVHH